MKQFDLIEYQQDARSLKKPGQLFELWAEVGSEYDRGLIGSYELEEMKSVIWPSLRTLCALQSSVNCSFQRHQNAA